MAENGTTTRMAKPFRSIGRRLSLSIALACIAVAILLSLLCYHVYRRQCIVSTGKTALAVAKTIANVIDGDQYAATMTKGEKDPFWDQIKDVLERTHKDTEAAFVYAVSPGVMDHYKYFATANFDVGVGFSQHRDFFAREVEETLALGTPTRSGVYDAGRDEYAEYGNLVSGFAPILDSTGKVVGAVGVDIAMDEALADARNFLYSLLLAAAIFAAAVGAFSLWRTRRDIMGPLAVITDASRHLALGDTDLKELPVERHDEFGVLARHFNHVARNVNSLAVGFVGTPIVDPPAPDADPAGSRSTTRRVRTGSHVPTGGLGGRYLATAKGINMVLTILDTLESMVYVVDPETFRFLFYTKKFGERYHIDNEEALTRNCWEILGRDKRCAICDVGRLAITDGQYPINCREMFDETSGSWLWVQNRLIHWLDGRVAYLSEGRDITEAKRLQEKQAEQERELRETTRAAQDANRMKTAFLANMSHEIRTPLNGVIGFAELASEEPGTPAKTREYLSKITASGEGLLQLITDILDVSKIETGNMELESIPFSIHDVFKLCEAVCQPKALEKGINLHFYQEPLLERQLSGDPTKLRQVLLNLISNAVKFTPAGGLVKVNCLVNDMTPERVVLQFEVRDNGIGMSRDQAQNIFNPFTQADSSITRKYGGTGLGLSISKGLVDMMDGAIWVESEPGLGSAFFFTVSLTLLDAPAGGARKSETAVIQKRPIFAGDALICEDNQINREVIGEHLRRVGLEPVMAEDGQIGVDLVRGRMESGATPFSVVFMDIHMPRMDGLEATRLLRGMHCPSPIIALTANVMATEKERYLREGMADCLGKPFSAKKLWQCLMRFLKPVELKDERSDAVPAPSSAGDSPVNRDVGLVYAANNPDLYERQLRHFSREQADFVARLDAALASGDRKHAYRLVHTLKGVSALIGALPLSDAAFTLERALSGEDGDGADKLPALREKLARGMDQVLGELSRLGDGPETRVIAASRRGSGPAGDGAPPSSSSRSSPGSPSRSASARRLLDRVLPLLRSNDGASLDYIERLGQILPEAGVDCRELLNHMERFDFEQAAEAAESMRGGLGE